jgi:hypothetical protein
LARGGAAEFDSLLIATDDPALAVEEAEAIRASSIGDGAEALELSDLQAIVDEAIRRLTISEDLTADEISVLRGLEFSVADLEGDLLATEQDGVITFDIDAAGHGFFIDDTPTEDEEFITEGANAGDALPNLDADGKIDLLTVAMHELGHALGFDHVANDAERAFMIGILDPSQRLGLFDEAGDDDSANVSSSEAQIFDARVGGFVSTDEALLLDSVGDFGVGLIGQSNSGKSKPKWVRWAGA